VEFDAREDRVWELLTRVGFFDAYGVFNKDQSTGYAALLFDDRFLKMASSLACSFQFSETGFGKRDVPKEYAVNCADVYWISKTLYRGLEHLK
jgi:hypothetical protein